MLFDRQVELINLFGTQIPKPTIFLDFLGFEKHVKQYRERRGASVPSSWYDHATYYMIDLPPDKLFGPDEKVSVPSCTKMPDYEFELGCIITKTALLTTMAEAIKYIRESCFITIVNDWSARDIQKLDMDGLGPTNSKLIIGKSIGPTIVPAHALVMDENGVFDLPMRLSVNGMVRCESNYKSLYCRHPKTGKEHAWSFAKLLVFLGHLNISVHPGYVLGSGTIGDGSIGELSAKLDPQTGEIIEPAVYPWLKDGDIVELEAQGIGRLVNSVSINDGPKH